MDSARLLWTFLPFCASRDWHYGSHVGPAQGRGAGPFITVHETAIFLSVSEKTIWRWMKSGKLTRYEIDGTRSVRLDLREVRQLVQPPPPRGNEP